MTQASANVVIVHEIGVVHEERVIIGSDLYITHLQFGKKTTRKWLEIDGR
jgi:hypothetical protein